VVNKHTNENNEGPSTHLWEILNKVPACLSTGGIAELVPAPGT
jgi:hypothetical protein